MNNLLYSMKSHDVLHFNDFTVVRVPGGLVYIQNYFQTICSVFVPFNNEFQINQESI